MREVIVLPKNDRRIGQTIVLSIARLPEGGYLATSDDVNGLIVQAPTQSEVRRIALDVAQQLIDAQHGRSSSGKRAARSGCGTWSSEEHDAERRLVRIAQTVSTPSLLAIWDGSEDAIYDND